MSNDKDWLGYLRELMEGPTKGELCYRAKECGATWAEIHEVCPSGRVNAMSWAKRNGEAWPVGGSEKPVMMEKVSDGVFRSPVGVGVVRDLRVAAELMDGTEVPEEGRIVSTEVEEESREDEIARVVSELEQDQGWEFDVLGGDALLESLRGSGIFPLVTKAEVRSFLSSRVKGED